VFVVLYGDSCRSAAERVRERLDRKRDDDEDGEDQT
jgi:hypothetical protein